LLLKVKMFATAMTMSETKDFCAVYTHKAISADETISEGDVHVATSPHRHVQRALVRIQLTLFLIFRFLFEERIFNVFFVKMKFGEIAILRSFHPLWILNCDAKLYLNKLTFIMFNYVACGGNVKIFEFKCIYSLNSSHRGVRVRVWEVGQSPVEIKCVSTIYLRFQDELARLMINAKPTKVSFRRRPRVNM
jgi:hypothetical protein